MNLKYLFYLALLFIFFSCTSKQEENKEEAEQQHFQLTEVQIQKLGLTTTSVQERMFSKVISVKGFVDVPPQNLVSISFPMSGYLKTTHLLPGMQIKKGESIAVLEDNAFIDLQKDFLLSQQNLILLDKELNRLKELITVKAASQQDYDKSKNEYQLEAIQKRSLEEKLKLIGLNPEHISTDNITKQITIRSPINGFVSEVNVNIGKYIQAGEVLFEIINPDDLHAALDVYERDAPFLSIGAKVSLYIPSLKETHLAEIIMYNRNFNENGSITVHCHFLDNLHGLLPGMQFNAEIKSNPMKLASLPSSSVLQDNGEPIVLILGKDKSINIHKVKVLSENDSFTAIEYSFPIESKIVSKGAFDVYSGMMSGDED